MSTAEESAARRAVTLFPFLVLLAGTLAYFEPYVFSPFVPYTAPLLGFIMFGMGLTLTVPDIKYLASHPKAIVIGIVAQFLIMPLVALAVVKVLQLPPGLAIGVILVGCAPGGTASNVVAYLAKADVALSVAMTTASTLVAPILTPLLVHLIAGTVLDLDGVALAESIAKMVVIPVVFGLGVRIVFPRLVNFVLPVLPWISTAGICIVIGAVVSQSTSALSQSGLIIFLAVALHNAGGLLVGYVIAPILGLHTRQARTICIEVGMQNSGLSATLAQTHFPMFPEAALPSAIFSVWHNISGSFIAAFFRRRS
ncbi:bile acid:sodium symporter family protein [Arcanobacterium ihumii]|uniref:bile acid:sodium symporter family protein n=1 Tax=Arcanobacterium ihumii TaxID=2138162 RepID=UPI000F5466E1|nr:bile acid:sodium symporter family protein [Arcanobacterium ihumii]